uniref:Ribonuclease H-like domain-containing protein n=1 Tax=Tanacetum cinerariifolium TaxID=118510 RepID=A0A6L2M9L3_TANCI|nr:ribonuclease H-like domain-containing protein [Tanacetum cinerariifolium]
MVNATKQSFDEDDLAKFQELLLDAEKPLYKGCPDFKKLSVIVKLLNLKGKYGASDKFFTELLGLLKKMLPTEKNVCESLVRTLLNDPRKTKDGMNARLDMAELGIKPELFARQEEDKTTLPSAVDLDLSRLAITLKQEVIKKGNGPVQVSTDTNGQIKVLPPKTAEEILARERERKAMTTLLMAIPEDHLAKFHKMTDAKEMWEAIKSRFGRNDESKKLKYLLKQQFKSFYVSNSEGLHKGYDRFQSFLSQLETHSASVSIEDANQKFLSSLPSSWFQISLIMRTKTGVDTLSFNDLYNNLRVFESDVKGSTGSSSSTHNVAFLSSENTSSTNEVNTAYDHEDLEQLDEFDLEEIDLKWQVTMISMRLKKFYKKIGRKLHFDATEPIGFEKNKVECFNCHNTWHFARECKSKGNQNSRRRDAGNTGHKAKDNGRRPAK